jgi:hypothetical protein
MNGFLKKKAELETQYKIADSISADFTKRNSKMINDINTKYLEQEALKIDVSQWDKEVKINLESSIFKANRDSAEKYEKNSIIFLNQIKSIEYSIDSLSKLK